MQNPFEATNVKRLDSRYQEEAKGQSTVLEGRAIYALAQIYWTRQENLGVWWISSQWLHGECHVVCQDNFTATLNKFFFIGV